MTKLFGILAVMLLVTGCQGGSHPSDGNPYPPVPNALPETIPNPPVTAEPLMWQPGHWDWNGSGYVWANGQYVPAADHGNLWVTGWWSRTATGWQWQPPHWTS